MALNYYRAGHLHRMPRRIPRDCRMDVGPARSRNHGTGYMKRTFSRLRRHWDRVEVRQGMREYEDYRG